MTEEPFDFAQGKEFNITEEDFKKRLTPLQYNVLREKGTEAPLTGEYVHTKDSGMYKCKACGAELFSSDTKFDSGTGWPSFTEPANLENVRLEEDTSLGTRLLGPDAVGNGGQVRRTEVVCAKCGSHLGHVFDDTEAKTGKHYCINSCALDLEKK